MSRDSNLLFGVFAVQLGKVSAIQIMDVAAAWALDTSRGLSSRLVELQLLSEPDRQLLQRFVDEAIAAHDGDPARTLISFGGEKQINQVYRGSIILTRDGQVSIPALDKKLDSDSSEAKADDISTVKGVYETPGRYTNSIEHARGGMGRVLLVHDDFLGRDIALKELLPHLGTTEESTRDASMQTSPVGDHPSPVRFSAHIIARFLQEARITGQLEHPSIVPVYELGHRRDGSLYYTMKLVRGRSLAKAIKDCMNFEERLRLLPHFVDLCQAIAYAHDRGIIHRDIKPANVMVGEFGETVVLDWGLAKKRDREDMYDVELAKTLQAMNLGSDFEAPQTAYGQVLGTPVYMAPEQASGNLEAVDERSDVYSLGALFFELLSNTVPVAGKNLTEILANVKTGNVRNVIEFEPQCPKELGAIIDKAMAFEAENRYQSAKEIADIVQGWRPREAKSMKRKFIERSAVITCVLLPILIALGEQYYTFRLDTALRDLKEKGVAVSIDELRSLSGAKPLSSVAESTSLSPSGFLSAVGFIYSDLPNTSWRFRDIFHVEDSRVVSRDTLLMLTNELEQYQSLIEQAHSVAHAPYSTAQEALRLSREFTDGTYAYMSGSSQVGDLLVLQSFVDRCEGSSDKALERIVDVLLLIGHQRSMGQNSLDVGRVLKYVPGILNEGTPSSATMLSLVDATQALQWKPARDYVTLQNNFNLLEYFQTYERLELGVGAFPRFHSYGDNRGMDLAEYVGLQVYSWRVFRILRLRDKLVYVRDWGPSCLTSSPLFRDRIAEESRIRQRCFAKSYIAAPFARLRLQEGDLWSFSHAARSEALTRCASAALSVRKWEKDHGSYPATLEELVPAYLEELPSDPFSEGSLLYKVEEFSFCVYSVGSDKRDDGGNFDDFRIDSEDTSQFNKDLGWRLKK